MAEKLESPERLKTGKQIIVFIGAEGSGKTTIATKLASEANKPYITTGDIIRDLATNDPGELGEECRVMFAEKKYLSGETLIKILLHRFSQEDVEDGLILDGGLRTYEETLAFPSMLDAAKLNLPLKVIHLLIPDEVSYDRLVNGPQARNRADDTLEGVASRLAKFHNRLEERLELIMEQPDWDLAEVDATKPLDEVYEQVLSILASE